MSEKRGSERMERIMKKTRILAIILALATVATSLPVIAQATASAETPLNTELLTKSDVLSEANWSDGTENTLNADVVKVSSTGTNTALYMYDKSENRTNKFIYTIKADLPAGSYRIKYDWTAQTPIDTGLFNGNSRNTDVMNFKIAGANKEGKLLLTNQATISRDFTLSSAVTSLPIEISYIDQNGRAGMILPKTFDNIKIYKLVNNVEEATPVVTRDFENGLANGDTWVKSIAGAAAVNASLITESDYVRVAAVTRTGTVAEAAAAGAYNKVAKYSPSNSVTLTPGVYEFSFDDHTMRSFHKKRGSRRPPNKSSIANGIPTCQQEIVHKNGFLYFARAQLVYFIQYPNLKMRISCATVWVQEELPPSRSSGSGRKPNMQIM